MALLPHPKAGFYLSDGGERLKAARALCGISSVNEFAKLLNLEGLGADTIRGIEAPSRPQVLYDHQAEAVARRLGLPISFFTAPLEYLGDMRLGVDAGATPSAADLLGPALDATADAIDRPTRSTPAARPDQAEDRPPPRRRAR